MVLLDNIHEVEATAEDGDGKGTMSGFTILVEGHVGHHLDYVSGHGEELLLAQALVDYVIENAESAVELGVGTTRDGSEDRWEEIRPVLGEVIRCDFSNYVAVMAW
jgi:hypothetical protein